MAIAAVVLLWAGFAYTTAQPTNAKSYTRAAMQVAQFAHDAAPTAALTGRLQRAGKVFPPFSTTAYDDASKGLAGAAKQLTEQVPQNEATAACGTGCRPRPKPWATPPPRRTTTI